MTKFELRHDDIIWTPLFNTLPIGAVAQDEAVLSRCGGTTLTFSELTGTSAAADYLVWDAAVVVLLRYRLMAAKIIKSWLDTDGPFYVSFYGFPVCVASLNRDRSDLTGTASRQPLPASLTRDGSIMMNGI